MPLIHPKKSLSQNFLVDENIARNIIRDLRLSGDDVVVEIGPGQGALTKYLAPRVSQLIAVEIDGRVVQELRARFAQPHVTILHQDFLELDLHEIHSRFGRAIRLVGNIPYHLTSSILLKAFDDHRVLQDCTLTVQREVAQRLAAKPASKAYGIFSVYSRFYGELEILFTVSASCFYPKPKVASAVIQQRFFPQPSFDVHEQLFRTVVRTVFGKRRKTVRNTLKYLPFKNQIVKEILAEHNELFERRPEQLTVEHYVELTKGISEKLHASGF